MSRAVLSASNWRSTDDAPHVIVRERLAFYCVLLRDQHGAGLLERELLGAERGMIVERMRLHVETRVAQQVEKTLRIADAGDRMHRLLPLNESSVRSRAVLQAVHLR